MCPCGSPATRPCRSHREEPHTLETCRPCSQCLCVCMCTSVQHSRQLASGWSRVRTFAPQWKDGPWDFTAANYVFLSISSFSQSHGSFCSPGSLHLASKLSFCKTVRRPFHFTAAVCFHSITFLSFQCPPHNEMQQGCLHIVSLLHYSVGPLLHFPFKPLLFPSFTNRLIWGAREVAYQLTKQWPPVISLSSNSPSYAWLLEFCSCMENCNLSPRASVVAVPVIMKVYFSLMHKHYKLQRKSREEILESPWKIFLRRTENANISFSASASQSVLNIG